MRKRNVGIAIASVITAGAVAVVGAGSSGFRQWDVKQWFKPAEIEAAAPADEVTDELPDEASENSEKLAAVQAELEATKSRVAELTSSKAALETALSELTDDLEDVQAQLEAAETQNAALTTQKQEIEGQLATVTAAAAALEVQLETATGDVSELEQQLETLAGQKSELEAELAVVNGQLETLAGEKRQLEKDVDTLQSEKSSYINRISDLNAQVSTLEGQINTMQASYDRLSAFSEKYRYLTYSTLRVPLHVDSVPNNSAAFNFMDDHIDYRMFDEFEVCVAHVGCPSFASYKELPNCFIYTMQNPYFAEDQIITIDNLNVTCSCGEHSFQFDLEFRYDASAMNGYVFEIVNYDTIMVNLLSAAYQNKAGYFHYTEDGNDYSSYTYIFGIIHNFE